MKKYLLSIVFGGVLLVGCNTTKTIGGKSKKKSAINVPIATSLDITKAASDLVPVTINPGRFSRETVTYRLPKVVPGTYSVSDFGKYIQDFKAFDYKGTELSVNQLDVNTWIINNAKELDYITYNVNDTYDIEVRGGMGNDTPFSPSGTNIEPNNYVLNLHGFIGYFDSLKNNEYQLSITAPINFKKSTALPQLTSQVSKDGSTEVSTYFAPRYFDITDNPMFYGDLSIEEFIVGDIKIVLSVYSPNKVHTAQSFKKTIETMMKAQKVYLGDINSTARYDIYLYLSEMKETSPKGFGALEHHTSTVVVLPEMLPQESLSQSMEDVVSHEFFHIITPLSVHSEDVHYFDYNNPTFSKHLWMYEGVTEYFANLFKVDQGLANEQEFYDAIIGKVNGSLAMDDAMSFTKMSENILDDPYKNQYLNVYQKGALIGMCIDILIREESNGNRGVLSLMKELSHKYGNNKPFNDDTLIEEIITMTYPSVEKFFNTHVIGNTPINYNEFFEKMGLQISDVQKESNYLIVNNAPIVSGSKSEQTIFFTESVSKISFWAEQGVRANDVIKSIDGTAVTLENANTVMGQVYGWKSGRDIDVRLERDGEEIVIKTTLTPSYTISKILQENKNATPAQKELRQAWLKG